MACFFYSNGKLGFESYVVHSDVEVPDDPTARFEDGDPQLDAAIRIWRRIPARNAVMRVDFPAANILAIIRYGEIHFVCGFCCEVEEIEVRVLYEHNLAFAG